MYKNTPFDILFESDAFLVVNKSAGIAVIREREPEKHVTLIDWLQKDHREPLLPVHRIDKDTSGIVLIAKTPEAQRKLSEQFATGQIEKVYLAMVDGSVDAPEWKTIDRPIMKMHNSLQVRIDPKGKQAITRYRTLENFRIASWLEVELVTGRTHQIRVHLSHIGYPLLVDSLYGNREGFFLSALKRKYQLKKYTEEQPLISRQTLHAARIRFEDPTSYEPLDFEAPLPKDLNALLNQLRKLTKES